MRDVLARGARRSPPPRQELLLSGPKFLVGNLQNTEKPNGETVPRARFRGWCRPIFLTP